MKVNEYLIKAKDRIVHEFEYKNGKYIQHYVLGVDHEMQPQDIIDCLNALATMDCDLAQYHAYIKGQQEENAQLKEEIEILHKALDLMSHELTTYEWQGLGKFARNEEIIKAEFIEQAKKEIK